MRIDLLLTGWSIASVKQLTHTPMVSVAQNVTCYIVIDSSIYRGAHKYVFETNDTMHRSCLRFRVEGLKR